MIHMQNIHLPPFPPKCRASRGLRAVFCAFAAIFAAVLLRGEGTGSTSAGKVIYYSEYGAKGDGVTDDLGAIIKAHAAANRAGAKVRADAGATYYVGGSGGTAEIQTDTDWGDAKFIIDDSKLGPKKNNRHLFNVSSTLPETGITSVKTLRKNQGKLDVSLPHDSVVVATDKTTKRFIREGLNQNNGQSQTDVFIAGKNGVIDANAPVIWDFNNISSLTAHPIDTEPLVLKGGFFTTIANQAESKYTYYTRGINITRSNVVVSDVSHAIKGEGEHGAPYSGFIAISECANVVVQNCGLSGHKTYKTIGSGKAPVSMGSYDATVNRSINVTFRNCRQINDINDTKRWGIFASNYSKNIMFDNVVFSRFDAHCGVWNATIKNSVLGHVGINLTGGGTFLIENSEVRAQGGFINLRNDYGSTWEGEVIIHNCVYAPANGAKAGYVLLNGQNSGRHDFGYTCHMPEKITIDGLVIDDRDHPANYSGPRIFANFNAAFTSEKYQEQYPYVITREVDIKNLTVKSGKKLGVSDNRFMFRNVRIARE